MTLTRLGDYPFIRTKIEVSLRNPNRRRDDHLFEGWGIALLGGPVL